MACRQPKQRGRLETASSFCTSLQMCSHVFMIFRPALRFLTRPFPPGDFAARLLAAVILPPLLFLAILAAPPVHDGNLWMKSVWINGPGAALLRRGTLRAAEANRTLPARCGCYTDRTPREDV